MNSKEMESRVKEVLTGRLVEVPYDISVPKYNSWQGPQPIPQEGYRVEYHGGAAQVLSRVRNRDQSLSPLRRPVRIEVDLNQHLVHVFLD
jgi:hypothetical protein